MEPIPKKTTSTVLKNVSQARQWYAEFGPGLLGDAELTALLEDYRESIEDTQGKMAATGIPSRCTGCASEKPGGCCFQGVEEWYDPLLLLVNLLLGVDIPESPTVSGACFFVGHEGCLIRARYSFCINYLCPRIKESLAGEDLAGLLETSGKELYSGLEVERKIIQWIQTHENHVG